MRITPATKKKVMGSIAFIAWLSLAGQFYLILQTMGETGFSNLKTISNFFSYFTILSNLLVAICLSSSLLSPGSTIGSFFSKAPVQAAIAVYIFIVGLVYNLVLRGLVNLSGLHWVVDNFLHVVVPLLFVIYWLVFTPKKILQWSNLLPWLIFPAAYLTYSLVRGPVADWYPYPFLHAGKLGYGQVAVNALFVLIAILLTGLGAIAWNRRGKS